MINTSKFSKGLFLVYNLMIVFTVTYSTEDNGYIAIEKVSHLDEPTAKDLLSVEDKVFEQKLGNDTDFTKQQIGQIMDSIQLGIKIGIPSAITEKSLANDLNQLKMFTFNNYRDPSNKKIYPYLVFILYAPLTFRYLRELFGIKSNDYVSSFCDSSLREISNPGASKSIFYITPNDKFIMKSVQQTENECLLLLLPRYGAYFKRNPRSLLPKLSGYFGLQTTTLEIKLLTMNNLLPSNVKMHQKYDLKGSTLGRQASDQEKLKRSPTFKDLDFHNEHHPNGLFLKEDTRSDLLKIIANDCELLENYDIMDYSLLMGIYNIDEPLDIDADASSKDLKRAAEIRWKSLMNDSIDQKNSEVDATTLADKYYVSLSRSIAATKSNGHRLLLFIGIIDILQTYRIFKELEYNLKALKLIVTTGQLQRADTISVQNPKFYASRFINYMTDFVFKPLSDINKQPIPKVLSNKRKSIEGDVERCPSMTNCFKSLKTGD